MAENQTARAKMLAFAERMGVPSYAYAELNDLLDEFAHEWFEKGLSSGWHQRGQSEWERR